MQRLPVWSLLLLPLLLAALPLAACQYSCPLIAFTQAVTPLPASASLLAASPAFSLSFVNGSPSLPLAFLDVHYAINGGDEANVRLVQAADAAKGQQAASFPFPAFVLQRNDSLDYFFTYEVGGIGLACNTQHFRVTGADVMTASRVLGREETEHSTETRAAPAAATAHRMRLPVMHSSLPPLVVPAVGLDGALAPDSTAVARPARDAFAAAASREMETLDQNPGVCPLIPFKQEVDSATQCSLQLKGCSSC